MRIGLRVSCQFLGHPLHLATAATLIALLTSSHRIRPLLSTISISLQRSISGNLFRLSQLLFGFRYTDSIGNQHIRLIRLPDEPPSSSPPHLTLHTFPLDQCPPYLALSYTWGPPEGNSPFYTHHDRRAILLDGRPFAVLPNLFHALSQLCISRPGQYLWVDSICINQASSDERSAQVNIMDYIYNGTTETAIWLGPASERTARAVDIVRQLAAGAEAKILEWARDNRYGDAYVVDDPEMLAKNGLPALSAGDWMDLQDVYARAWFGRVWMLQEVALSRNPTVLLGPVEVPWDVVGDAAAVTAMSGALLGLCAIGSDTQNISLVLGFVHAIGLQVVRQWSLGDESRYQGVLASTDYAAGIDTKHPSAILLELLLSSSGFRATYRKDRVYALLGVANHMARMQGRPRLEMEVNYDSTDDVVLTKLGVGFFRDTESLHLLSHAGLAGRSSSSSSIPTWIPSFESIHAPILGPNYANLRPLDASAGHEPDFTVDEAQLRLHVKAVSPHLGTIEEVGELWPEMLQGRFDNIMRMLLHCGTTYVPTQQPIVEAFWRTLIMDNDMTQRPAPPHLARAFSAWMFVITVSALCATLPANPFIFDHFDSLEPLWTLANTRDSTNSLPKAGEMLPLLYEFGLRHDPTVTPMSDLAFEERFDAWNKTAAPFEALLRLTLMANRRIARTVRGYLCLVPFKAEVGDSIMIVAGCPTPLVLKRVMEVENCFQVVGDAYVHGAMFGEHVTGDSVWRDISLV
ncbi:hypothetical protein ACJ41O_010853 [Fusarium nematophilum]